MRRDRLTIPEDRADHPLLAIGVDARALPHGDQRVILVTSGHSLLTGTRYIRELLATYGCSTSTATYPVGGHKGNSSGIVVSGRVR